MKLASWKYVVLTDIFEKSINSTEFKNVMNLSSLDISTDTETFRTQAYIMRFDS